MTPQVSELLDETSRGFIAYPPAGYVPAEINSPYWSVSCEGADFSSATVKMTDAAGKSVPVMNILRNNSYGHPAIIWEVAGAAAVRSVYNDTRFNVQVTGIAGPGIPTSLSYSVTLIHPDRITSNQNLTGPKAVRAKKTALFTFTPPSGTEAVQVVSAIKRSTKWKENAESAGKARLIDGTGRNYSLIAKMASFPGFGTLKGKAALRLTFPDSYDSVRRGVPQQYFELDREILPKSKAKLNFVYRRGYMTRGSVMVVEMSANGGLTWKTLGKPIKGVSDTMYDVSLSSANLSLPKSSVPVRIRFRYYTTGGSIYTQEAAPTSPTGIFLDDITVKNADWLETKKATVLSGASRSFSFGPSTAGAKPAKGDKWHLRLRTKLGGHWFVHGPSKVVSITK
ncbi:MAG: hypothetical protein EOP85_10130 [Verrucomicrobiaceae bacterium]|nr:MAG: hypothetical protein EOP85_10130 [Verrucomicrobiaceae bacterium]